MAMTKMKIPVASAAAAATTTTSITLVDSSGSLTRALLPNVRSTANGGDDGGVGGGIVALLSSPGTPNPLFFPPAPAPAAAASSSSTATNAVTVDADGSIIRAPGASLEDSGSSLARGVGAAAASYVAGSVVMTGVTVADVEAGLDGTRHGRTLAELFAASVLLRSSSSSSSSSSSGGDGEGVRTTPIALTIAVQSSAPSPSSSSSGVGGWKEDEDVLDADELRRCVEEIFDSVAAASGVDDALGDHFDVSSTLVSNPADVERVMSAAKEAAAANGGNRSVVPTAFAEAYRRIASVTSDHHADPTPVAEAILACNDAYSRASRTSRAKIASWRHRVSRNLIVPDFGNKADALLTSTLDLFDRDTMAAAGLPRAGSQRLIVRRKLHDRTGSMIRRLFDDQMTLLEKRTLRKFQAALLRKMDEDEASATTPGADISKFLESNADSLRSAAFAFDVGASSLEVPSLSLTKSRAVRDMDDKLNGALNAFPDSPAARIRSMAKVRRVVSKKKQPTEGSVSVALDLIAMIRPDGFGNLQGFAGYQLGPHSVTVGVHNDADDPGVISQFGGVRPPFLRVQPKLKLDVEL